MADDLKISAGLWVFAGCLDRFCPGYSQFLNTDEQIKAAAKVKNLKGLEVIYPWHFEGKRPLEFKKRIEDSGLKITSVNPNLWADKKFKFGSFSSTEPVVRRETIELCKRTIDIAREVGCNNMLLWPGQDGFDYSLQTDYRDLWKWEVEGIRKVAEYGKDMNISIEYKLKEPRNHIVAGSAATVIALAEDTGMKNVGANLDFGHSLMSKENPAMAAVLLARHNRLFNVHMNDCYGEWDDDLMVGSVHITETIEFLYYLSQLNYRGWLSLDITPYREDAVSACQVCIDTLRRLWEVTSRIDGEQLKALQSRSDAVGIQRMVQDVLAGK